MIILKFSINILIKKQKFVKKIINIKYSIKKIVNFKNIFILLLLKHKIKMNFIDF